MRRGKDEFCFAPLANRIPIARSNNSPVDPILAHHETHHITCPASNYPPPLVRQDLLLINSSSSSSTGLNNFVNTIWLSKCKSSSFKFWNSPNRLLSVSIQSYLYHALQKQQHRDGPCAKWFRYTHAGRISLDIWGLVGSEPMVGLWILFINIVPCAEAVEGGVAGSIRGKEGKRKHG